jgi:hypothetical protein
LQQRRTPPPRNPPAKPGADEPISNLEPPHPYADFFRIDDFVVRHALAS